MECNKDEATRAKEIAECKMQSGDFVGALKFASKAKRLFPDIQNIVQIITVCEVHCAAQNKVFGSDMDWYGILQTEQVADEATVKKQYRKLALLLHPDKNKSVGAEAAFKLIGEANRVLSDRVKRSLYDRSRRFSIGTAAPNPPSHNSNGSSFVPKHDGNARNSQSTFNSHSPDAHQWDEKLAFWTSCQHCSTRYQYYKTIINATVRCQQCSKSFIARDMGYQGVPPGYMWTSFHKQKEAPKYMPPKASESNGGKTCGRGQSDNFVRSNPVSMSKCTAGVGGHCKVEKHKDGYVASGRTKAGMGTSKVAASKPKESQTSPNARSKRARQSELDSRDDNKVENDNGLKNTNVRENDDGPYVNNAAVHQRKASKEKQHVPCTETAQDGDFANPSKRPRQYGSFNAPKVEKGEHDHVQVKEASKSDGDGRKSNADNCSAVNSNFPPHQEEITCPDSDFSDFDKDKAEDCFVANQFWAIYDNYDSMPRYYALVKKVFSPFKLQITWLEPDPDDQGEINWDDAGLPVGCGKFKLGDSLRTADLAMFSHQMHCIKGSGKGSYLVFPKKRETWALFRDWDIGWSSNREKDSEFQFEYVEVLSDFDENVGIEVAYLDKVKGFVSLFQQTVQNGISLFRVPPNELYRFSHRVPSYKMTGDEREDVPRGSFELDPAGLPSNLFVVGDPCEMKMKDAILNNGVSCSHHESSKCKVEQAMPNESLHEEKLSKSNDAERVPSILRKSPRSNRKGMGNGQVSPSECVIIDDDDVDIDHKDCGQPEGTAAAHKANEKVKTPRKQEKNNYERETLKVRRSPRDISKKNAQVDKGECITSKVTDNHSNANKNMKESSFTQSGGSVHTPLTKAGECATSKVTDNHSNVNKNVKGSSFSKSGGSVQSPLKKDCGVAEASRYDFKKEKSEEKFQCGQIWAIYGDKDRMPAVYAQIKKIESARNFKLHVSLLEPFSSPKDSKRTVSCGTFVVKKVKPRILSLSEFSHQLKVEPVTNNLYEIYPRKGEVWALYKDQNYDLTCSNPGRGECHMVEILAYTDNIIQVVILTPVSSSQPFFRAPRIQRSKSGVIEIFKEEVGRFSHQIPAIRHSGEDNVHLRGCWELDPASIPGFI
ncbi:putative DnaJ domain-containing protein [Lupinus albus]|uniref:Putative DnaJ domain-containing protein n=1 Tax=Lupinus albus TaxID=3870 RepID=A0A6A4QSW8_LUPAL|nr:putative DnaJ domain-containing protein [Lupinus albus]